MANRLRIDGTPRKTPRRVGLRSPVYDGPRLIIVTGRHASQIAAADELAEIDALFATARRLIQKATKLV